MQSGIQAATALPLATGVDGLAVGPLARPVLSHPGRVVAATTFELPTFANPRCRLRLTRLAGSRSAGRRRDSRARRHGDNGRVRLTFLRDHISQALPTNEELVGAMADFDEAPSNAGYVRLGKALISSRVIVGTRRRPLLWRFGRPIPIEMVKIRGLEGRDAYGAFTNDEAFHHWAGPGSHDHLVLPLKAFCMMTLEETTTDVVINPGGRTRLLNSWDRAWLASALVPGAMRPLDQSADTEWFIQKVREFLVTRGVDRAGLFWATGETGSVLTLVIDGGGKWKGVERVAFRRAYREFTQGHVAETLMTVLFPLDDIGDADEVSRVLP
jgi:SseB protein N-terminal domain